MKLFRNMALMVVACTTLTTLASSIAILDAQKIVRQSPAVKKISQDLKDRYSKQQKEIATEQTKLRDAFMKLSKNKQTMKLDDWNKQRTELLKKVQENRKQELAASKAYMQEEQQAVGKLFEHLKEVVAAYSKKNKIDLVLLKSAAVTVSDNRLDITDKVQKQFNAKVAQK